MKRLIAVVLLTTFALPQCTARRLDVGSTVETSQLASAARAGDLQDSPDLMRRYVRHLPIGSKVRITFKEGKKLNAILMVVDEESIVVKPRTRIPEPAQTIPIDRIAAIEIHSDSSVGKAIGIGTAVGAATFVGIWALLIAIYND